MKCNPSVSRPIVWALLRWMSNFAKANMRSRSNKIFLCPRGLVALSVRQSCSGRQDKRIMWPVRIMNWMSVSACLHCFSFAVEFYYKFDVEVYFFLKSALGGSSGVTGSRDFHWYVSRTLQAGSRDQVILLESYIKSDFAIQYAFLDCWTLDACFARHFFVVGCWDLLFSSSLQWRTLKGCILDASYLLDTWWCRAQ